jgi:hypothetical protein
MSTTARRQQSGRLTNYMEELTEEILGDMLSEDKSARFTANEMRDIRALALNRLWPMYTTTNSGKDFLRRVVEEDKIEKDVVRELRAAMDIVRANPRE